MNQLFSEVRKSDEEMLAKSLQKKSIKNITKSALFDTLKNMKINNVEQPRNYNEEIQEIFIEESKSFSNYMTNSAKLWKASSTDNVTDTDRLAV